MSRHARHGHALRSAFRAQYNRGFVVAGLLVLLPAVVVGDRVRRGSGRRILRWGVSIVASLCGVRFEVHGRSSGDRPAGVVVANHSSPMDIPALLWADPDVRFVATSGLFRIPVLAAAMRALGTVPIDRHDHDRAQRQLDEMVDRPDLVAGGDVAVFPEGGIAPTGQRLPFKTGAFTLAIRTGNPVVPVAIHGSDRVLAPGARLLVRPGVVTVEFLQPVDVTGLTLEDRHVLRDHVRDRVCAAVGRRQARTDDDRTGGDPDGAVVVDPPG
jgi:1-acyl-sn-glycerol-3-phosphate acyltransferase